MVLIVAEMAYMVLIVAEMTSDIIIFKLNFFYIVLQSMCDENVNMFMEPTEITIKINLSGAIAQYMPLHTHSDNLA